MCSEFERKKKGSTHRVFAAGDAPYRRESRETCPHDTVITPLRSRCFIRCYAWVNEGERVVRRTRYGERPKTGIVRTHSIVGHRAAQR